MKLPKLLFISLLFLVSFAVAIPQSSPAKSPAPAPTASDIAAAKASHKVWVNLDTGIYHKGGPLVRQNQDRQIHDGKMRPTQGRIKC